MSRLKSLSTAYAMSSLLLGTGCDDGGNARSTEPIAPTSDYERVGPIVTVVIVQQPASVAPVSLPPPESSETAATPVDTSPPAPAPTTVPTSAPTTPGAAGQPETGAGGNSTSPGGAAGTGGTEGAGGSNAEAGSPGDAGEAGSGGTPVVEPPPEFELLGAPLLFNPTTSAFSVNAVVVTGDPALVRATARRAGSPDWIDASSSAFPTTDVAEWRFEGLEPGTLYEYQVLGQGAAGEVPLYAGTVTTQRTPDDEHFVFALVTDTHIAPRSVAPGELDALDDQERILVGIAPKMRTQNPDFIVNLGDMLDFHLFGFNAPPPDGSWTRLAYLNYRRLMQDALGNAAHFPVIGNWDGENGDFSAEEIAWSREQRLLYAPGPTPTTYPEGGSEHQDYYAFTWGNALFVVLNVMTYTPTSHLLSTDPGVADDWTLGDAQLAWFMDTLANATSKWRFVLIHHTVGGAAGDEINAAYGRGGGQAAQVGEQALVHQLMIDHGVQIFFYGHDHVFADMVVDDIHYTLPGSAGAPWKFTTAETGYVEYWPDSGYARVEVSDDNVQVHFISETDELLYGYTIGE
jgi:hypothetical protein